MSIVITGGQGDLGKVLAETLGADSDVLAPGRLELDVTDPESVSQYFAALDSLDLLICNAGKTLDSLLLKMGEASWDEAIDINLKGAFLCAQAAVKKMVKARTGHIIFISSHSAFVPPVGQSNYAAAKAGLLGLAKSLAQEVGGRGVRVNVIVPGWLETQMTSVVSEQASDKALAQHCLGVFNTPVAVAQFAKTLHQQMPYTSGQVFHLDSRILSK